MSTNPFPRYTVIACTDNGDIPAYAYDPTLARVLIERASRSRHVGCVILEENQVEVGRARTDNPEAVAELIDVLTDEEVAA